MNTKKLALIFLTGFVLTSSACHKKTDFKDQFMPLIVAPNLKIENDSLEPKDIIEEDIIEQEEIKRQEDETFEIIGEVDGNSQINQYLNDIENELEEIKKTDIRNIEQAKEFTISSFITLVDFKYYGKEINGITYDELSEETKQNISDTFDYLESIIESYFPEYKETISSKYSEAKESIYNQLGEENVLKLEDAKDSLKDAVYDVSDVLNDTVVEPAKTKVKTWYEQFRENH